MVSASISSTFVWFVKQNFRLREKFMDLDQYLWDRSVDELRQIRSLVDSIIAAKQDRYDFVRDVPPEVQDIVAQNLREADVRALGRFASTSRTARDVSRRYLDQIKESDRKKREEFEETLEFVYRTYDFLQSRYNVHHSFHIYNGLVAVDVSGEPIDQLFMIYLREKLGAESLGDLQRRLQEKASLESPQPFVVAVLHFLKRLSKTSGQTLPGSEIRKEFSRGTTVEEVARFLLGLRGTVEYTVQWK